MSYERVSDAIRALRPPEDAPEEDYPKAFRAIADLLLNRTTLFIAGKPHRLTEIEVYWNGLGHQDPFTHGDPRQRELGVWYFHRQGGEYRGGTYKGVDVAFGCEGAFGGLLVRGARAQDGSGTILDGPCTFVDHVLALTGAPSIAALMDRFDGSIDALDTPGASHSGSSPLALKMRSESEGQRIFTSARVGLTLKRGPTQERQRFLARPYRFLTGPKDIKKGRVPIALGLYRAGTPAEEIASLTAISRSNVGKYIYAYEAGAELSPEDFAGDLSTDDLCGLLGACDRRFASAYGD